MVVSRMWSVHRCRLNFCILHICALTVINSWHRTMWFGTHLMHMGRTKKFGSRRCMFSCDFFFFFLMSSVLVSYLIPGETSGMIAAPFPWLMLQLRDDFTSTGYFGSICLPWETVGMCHPSLFVNGSASSLGKLRLESWWFQLCLCAVFV